MYLRTEADSWEKIYLTRISILALARPQDTLPFRSEQHVLSR